MKKKYQNWIDENYLDKESTIRQCKEATEAMEKAFPELRRVRGHYIDIFKNKHAHWWLEKDGEIIDPTAWQFSDGGFGEYQEYEGREPIGKCMYCGKWCYDDHYHCSDECRQASLAYLNDRNDSWRKL